MGSILHFNIIDSFQVYRIGFISVMYEENKIHINKPYDEVLGAAQFTESTSISCQKLQKGFKGCQKVSKGVERCHKLS